jgi:hypothetical protein
MRHLDTESLEKLGAGDRELSLYFAQHLKAPCESCEEFLAGSDVLDGAADALLFKPVTDRVTETAHVAPAELNELGFRKVMKGLRGSDSGSGAPAARPRRDLGMRAVMGLAIAAGIAAFFVPMAIKQGTQQAAPGIDQGRDPGLKAGSTPMLLQISAVEKRADGSLVPIADGARIAPDSVLLFRYQSNASGKGALVIDRAEPAGGAAKSEVLTEVAVQAGTHDVALDGSPMGITVADEHGGIRLRLVGQPGNDPLDTSAALKGETRSGAAQSGIFVHVDER